MHQLKKWMSIVLFSLFTSSTIANTFISEMTDLWWNANESGWGVTITHQGEIAFLTFFVYGADNKPVWYTGQATYTTTNSQGQAVFSGPVYQTSGPWLGGVFFNPNSVGVRQVGTLTLTAYVSSATLLYIIDGVPVVKSITRQTFRNNNMTGKYWGATYYQASGCVPTSLNQGYVQPNTDFMITHTTTSLSLRVLNLLSTIENSLSACS